jgi:hypothetical protein
MPEPAVVNKLELRRLVSERLRQRTIPPLAFHKLAELYVSMLADRRAKPIKQDESESESQVIAKVLAEARNAGR